MGYATAYGLLMGARRAVPCRMARHVRYAHGGPEYKPAYLNREEMRFLLAEQEKWRERRRERKRKKKRGEADPEPERIVTLAIETSCDDTCVAVLERRPTSTTLLFNSKVTSDNRQFGGVEPITAVSSHASQLAPLMQAAAEALPPTSLESGLPDFDPVTNRICGRRRRPDFIAVTRGPGLTSALSVGLTAAKGLAAAWKVPLVAVHHMQAHALTPRLVHAIQTSKKPPPPSPRTIRKKKKGAAKDGSAEVPEPGEERWQEPEPAFPFLSLLVSGGHTQLVLSRSVTSHSILADARNVAIGDMLDKCARAILPADVLAGTDNVMYGARLESFAFGPPPEEEPSPPPEDPYETYYGYTYKPPLKRRDEIQPYVSPTYGWTLRPPLAERRDMAFDFSGLGGQVQAIMKKNPDMDVPQRRELARETMRLAFEHLVTRVIFALDRMREEDREANKERRRQSTTTTTTTTTTTATGATEEEEPAGTSIEASSEAVEAEVTTPPSSSSSSPPPPPPSQTPPQPTAITTETTTIPTTADSPLPAETTTANAALTTGATEDAATAAATEPTTTATATATTTDPTTATTAEPATTTETDNPSTTSSIPKTLVVAGGVAANRFLQHVLGRMLAARGYPADALAIVRPPAEFCTDNAAMVAWAGMEMWEAGWYSDLNVLPQRRWSLDGDGILGLGGWLPRSELEAEKRAKRAAEAEAKAREQALARLEKEMEERAVGEGSKKEGDKAAAAQLEDWTIHWTDWNDKWGKPPEPGKHYDWAADWEDWDRFEERQRLRQEERRRERIQRWLEFRKLTAWVGRLKKRHAKKLRRMREERIKLKYQ
ncbi:hypothetical protein VTH06DRAFT_4301 [Thermothelomyces fergusii]